jgi:hypothetical protein
VVVGSAGCGDKPSAAELWRLQTAKKTAADVIGIFKLASVDFAKGGYLRKQAILLMRSDFASI